MNSQLYTAASGLIVEARRLDLTSNNLSNLSTPGFRAQRAFATVYHGAAAGQRAYRAANEAVALAGSYELPGAGPMRSTGRALDVALQPEELLVVETPAGRRYTRAGTLQISADLELVDGSGNRLLNPEGKPIKGLTPAASIGADGRVVDGGAERGRLLVVRDPQGVLRPEGAQLYGAAGRDTELENVEAPQLRVGWIEQPNTRAVEEMIQMIEAQRAFETYQRLVSVTMNEVNRAAVRDIVG